MVREGGVGEGGGGRGGGSGGISVAATRSLVRGSTEFTFGRRPIQTERKSTPYLRSAICTLQHA